jgi:uncharacterized protein
VSDFRPLAESAPEWAEWWDATRERRFLLQRCERCGHVQHYPRSLCTQCGSDELGWQDASGEGTVYSYTVVHRPPVAVPPAPYVVALVRLAEGPLALTNIVECDPDEVRCDLPVSLAWEPLEDGRNLAVFAPT